MATTKRFSFWGVASLALLVGQFAFGEYNLNRYDHTGAPWIWFELLNQICAPIQLAAGGCGILAMRTASKWWGLAPVAAVLYAIACFLGNL